jgi:hypothetical protein
MMFSLSETVVLVPPQLAKPQDALARSTNRYSALAVQFGAKGMFETDAGGPACLRGAHERKRAGGSLDIAKRRAGGAIEKNAVPGPAGAAAHGGEPIALRRAADKRA